jgi:acyl carrier protein
MDYSEITLQVEKILADKLNLDLKKISLDSQLINDLGLDSFGSIEVVFELEDKFGLKIPDQDIAQAKTVKDIVDYIFSQTNKK